MSMEYLSRYFASFYALCDAATLTLQLTVSGYVFRRFGISIGMAVLPVVLGVCLLGGLLSGAQTALLIWMTCAKGTDILRRGLHDPSLTMAYQPISTMRRRRVIGFVNGTLKPLIEAGVVLVIFAIGFLADRTSSLFFVAMLLIPVWSASCWRVLTAFPKAIVKPA